MTNLPNDSTKSVTTISANIPPRSTPPLPSSSRLDSSPTQPSTSKNNSPQTPNPCNNPTPTEQAAPDLENSSAAQQAQEGVDVDSGADAQSVSDTGYETDSVGTASKSLTSSIRNHAFENGRRYHRFREGAYNFPNDDKEQDREDMKHDIIVSLCQQLHFAPLEAHPQNILDMGTGTGIWAIEMGDLYRAAHVLGLDLSPIQPEWVPPNVKFMVDDVESPWLRPKNHFDYIHARHMVVAIKDWPKLMERAFDHLKPGGWFELQEIHHYPQSHDDSVPADHAVAVYWGLIAAGLAALGVDSNATLLLAEMVRQAGFVNVTTRIFHIPIGVWPRNKVLKLIGLYWRTIIIDGLQPIALGPLTRGLKWTTDEVESFLVEVRKAYMDGSVHSHMPLYIICGQKPDVGFERRE